MKKLFLFASVFMALLLCTAMMIVLPAAATADEGVDLLAPGPDTWSFDAQTGTLTVSYASAMPAFDAAAPWAEYRSEIKAVEIKEGVTSISNKAFASCTALKNVHIPKSVTSIGDYAFRFCEKLETVTFAEHSRLTSIGTYAFEECSALVSIGLTAKMPVTYIGTYAFAYCSSLKEIVIPRTLNAVANYTFHYCTDLEKVEFALDSNVKSIGVHAFRNCKSLTTVAIPDGVTSIGASAFHGCSALTAVTLPTTLANVGDDLFHGCSALTSVYCDLTSEEWETKITCGAYNEVLDGALKYRGEAHTCIMSAWVDFGDGTHSQVCACGEMTDGEAHIWDSGDVTKPQTHLELGVKTYTCTHCGAFYTEDIEKLPAHTYGSFEPFDADQHKAECDCGEIYYENHVWNEGVAIQAATHTTEGIRLHTCKDCGQTKEEPIAKLEAHTEGKWESYDDNTHRRVCVCGEVLDEKPHNWNEGEIITSATHVTEGVKEYTCTDCGHKKNEAVPRLEGHVYVTVQPVGEGEVDANGNPVDADIYHKRVCACGAAIYDQKHTYDIGFETQAPTHLVEGVKTYTCKDCGHIKTHPIEKLPEHTYGDWISVDGEQHKKECACGDAIFEAHNYSEWRQHTDAVHVRNCVCGTEEALHEWDEGVVTQAPTHLVEGVRTFTCSICYANKTEAEPTTAEHTFGDWVYADEELHQKVCACGHVQEAREAHEWNEGEDTTPATHLEFGVKTYTCKVCGGTKTEKVEKLPDHTYDRWLPYDDEQHQWGCACGEPEIDGKKADHVWESEITVQPTHLATGVKTFTCVCGAEYTEVIAKTPTHTYRWVQYNDDQHQAACACGQTKKEYADHNWNEGTVLSAPTHTTTGEKKVTCLDCGAEKVVSIPVTADHTYGGWIAHDDEQHKKTCACGDEVYAAHTFDEGVVTKEATKKEAGEMLLTCQDCGATLTQAIDQLPGINLVIIIAIAAAVVVAVVVIVILVVRKRRMAAVSGMSPSSAALAFSSAVGLAVLAKKARRRGRR